MPHIEPYRPPQPPAHPNPTLPCQGVQRVPLGAGRHPLTPQCPSNPVEVPAGILILPRDPHLGSLGLAPHPWPVSPAGTSLSLSLSPTRSLGSWARTAKVASWRHWHLVCAGRVSRVWQLSVSQFPKPASLINGTEQLEMIKRTRSPLRLSPFNPSVAPAWGEADGGTLPGDRLIPLAVSGGVKPSLPSADPPGEQ